MSTFKLKAIEGHADFDPVRDIPSLEGKVIFITGGTTGLGAASAKHLAAHNPQHIYISGRNATAGNALVLELTTKHPHVGATFVPLDLASLGAVKESIKTHFKHDRLDILMNNAGIMAQPAALSKDGYEVQFATNHLGHAMLTDCLLPVLLRTAKMPGADVRVLTLSSLGYQFHPRNGISFAELNAGGTMKRWIMGGWIRYAQSKLANILFASELARRHPEITSVSVHPGVVLTDLYYTQAWWNRWFIDFGCWAQGLKLLQPHQGSWNQVWCAAAAEKGELVSGGFYYPVGVEKMAMLDKTAKSAELAKELWDWTEGVLAKF
ncbi:NAD(P)-binding protein [Lentithecium fluviatile CBS 122367]|uniref:NAD(P)-binding protein n=1 Tax=Lentithecium fluviatile CBS 122367 TaxID=1168545 RepID=A0A6G1JCR6_9PLEO|nr:NAD(P)-binding protein [Lentithecium fluviatile CBS 122367]